MKYLTESELNKISTDILNYLNRFFNGDLTIRAINHVLGLEVPSNIVNSMRTLYLNKSLRLDVIKAMVIYHHTRSSGLILSYNGNRLNLSKDTDWFFIKDIIKTKLN